MEFWGNLEEQGRFKESIITWGLSWLKSFISFKEFKGISLKQLHTNIMLYWYIIYDEYNG